MDVGSLCLKSGSALGLGWSSECGPVSWFSTVICIQNMGSRMEHLTGGSGGSVGEVSGGGTPV
jgi:hypothetical protein